MQNRILFKEDFMKSFFSMFYTSLKELKSIRCIAITGIFITISMVIEAFTIDLVIFKINFAFLAIAVIGMLFGPTVGLIAGFACDIVGFVVHPQGGFIPIYILVAGLQGLIYGIVLYHKKDKYTYLLKNNKTDKLTDITLHIRAIVARVIDVVLINILINTKLNMHYGFIPDEIYIEAVVARTAKNVLELIVDIPLLFIILPITLAAYRRLSK